MSLCDEMSNENSDGLHVAWSFLKKGFFYEKGLNKVWNEEWTLFGVSIRLTKSVQATSLRLSSFFLARIVL